MSAGGHYWEENVTKIPEKIRGRVTQRMRGRTDWNSENSAEVPSPTPGTKSYGWATVHSIAQWPGWPGKPTHSLSGGDLGGMTMTEIMEDPYTTSVGFITHYTNSAAVFNEILERYKQGSAPDAMHDYYHQFDDIEREEKGGWKAGDADISSFKQKLQKNVLEATGIPAHALPTVTFKKDDAGRLGYETHYSLRSYYIVGSRQAVGVQDFSDVLLALYLASDAGKEEKQLEDVKKTATEALESLDTDDAADKALLQKGLQDLLDCIEDKDNPCTGEEAQSALDSITDQGVRYEQIKFNSQCVLSGPFNVNEFSVANVELRYEALRFRDYTKMFFLRGDPSKLMSLMTTPPGAGELMDITTQELAELVPTIRLYKVYRDSRRK